MSNPLIMRYAAGMAGFGYAGLGGSLEDDWFKTTGSVGGSSGQSVPWWQQIIAPVSAFGQQFLTQWGNREAYRNQLNPNAPAGGYPQTGRPPTAEEVAAAMRAQQGGGGGDGLGIRLADGYLWLGQSTKISYTTLLFGAGVLYLIQSPGFTRRGR